MVIYQGFMSCTAFFAENIVLYLFTKEFNLLSLFGWFHSLDFVKRVVLRTALIAVTRTFVLGLQPINTEYSVFSATTISTILFTTASERVLFSISLFPLKGGSFNLP